MSSKITKISAKPRDDQSHKDQDRAVQDRKIKAEKPAKLSKTDKKIKHQENSAEKPLKSVFILARPFVALGRYLRDSWRELRMVRWPNRKATWKMTLAVLVYCAIFIVFIVLLDLFFTFIFNLIFGTN